ncbi:NaeI family type II restriction endonuclease [Streptomyces tubercidicus]|uniref:NaeI family type II restriction endonuclease n=1 Tax=Streptomyces tubercidicus TaxID=47759 RepID=UPI002E131667|nr:hypothetical protein OG761_02250 [Streptomyces tubercidicus]
MLTQLMGKRGDDEELTAVARTVLALDPGGTRVERVLRDTIDAALDGPRTGRYVSARIVPAAPASGKPVVELDGGLWCVASPGDPLVVAPVLPTTFAGGKQ